jgi:hypothetical protein
VRAGAPVSADSEDALGRDSRADCVLVAAGWRDIDHSGSARHGTKLEVLHAARRRLAAGQSELEGLTPGRSRRMLRIV